MAASPSRFHLGTVLVIALLAGPLIVPASAQHESRISPEPLSSRADGTPCFDADSLCGAAALLRQGRHRAARAAFAEFLRGAPGTEGWRAVANAYLAEGQLPEAIAALQEMRRLEPDPALSQLLGGLVLALEGARARAAAGLSEALQLHPNARLWSLLGRQLDLLGRDVEAIQAYGQATRLSPDEPRYWRSLGEAYERAGQPGKAIEAYGEAVTLQASAEAWSAIGRIQVQERRYLQGVQAYHQAVKLEPSDLDALAGLAIAYGALKEWPAALDTYYRVKSVDAAAAEELFGVVFRGKTK